MRIPSNPACLFSLIKSLPSPCPCLRGCVAALFTDSASALCAPSDESCPSDRPGQLKIEIVLRFTETEWCGCNPPETSGSQSGEKYPDPCRPPLSPPAQCHLRCWPLAPAFGIAHKKAPEKRRLPFGIEELRPYREIAKIQCSNHIARSIPPPLQIPRAGYTPGEKVYPFRLDASVKPNDLLSNRV